MQEILFIGTMVDSPVHYVGKIMFLQIHLCDKNIFKL